MQQKSVEPVAVEPVDLVALVALLVAVVGVVPCAAAQTEFEPPPTLRASELLPPEQQRGEHFTVDERVENDGLMNHFIVRSEFGDFEADSEAMLRIRVQEVEAIAKLQEISKTKAFADTLKAASLQPVKTVQTVVTKPVATAKALPGGVNRAARGLFYQSRKMAHKVNETVRKDDETDEPDEPGVPSTGTTETDSLTPGEEAVESKGKVAATTAKAGKEIQDQIGYTRARRDLAARLGVDPYSSNEVLQQELSRLAQAAWFGGLSFRFAMPAVKTLGYIDDVNSMVWELTPDELERRNNKALGEMEVPKAVRLELFENKLLTATLQTALVAALSGLEGATGREYLVELAAAADTKRDGRRILASAAILAKYHQSEQPLAELEVVGSERFGELIVGVTKSGHRVLPVAADYLIWQQGMAGGPLEALTDKELRLTGQLSPRARRELESRGWAVHTQVLGASQGAR